MPLPLMTARLEHAGPETVELVAIIAAQLEAGDRAATGANVGSDEPHPGPETRAYIYTNRAVELLIAAEASIERAAARAKETGGVEAVPYTHRPPTVAEQQEGQRRIREEEGVEA